MREFLSLLKLDTWISSWNLSSLAPKIGAFGITFWILANYKFLSAVIRTFPRDMKALYRLIRVGLDLKYYQRNNMSVADAFDETVKRNPNKVLLYFEDQKWTALDIQNLSHKIANYFQSMGLKKGDSVGIFMENCSEYLSVWLGLSRIGCTGALVNYNLRQQPLRHCFEAVNCKAIIFNSGLTSAIQEVKDAGGLDGVPLFCVGEVDDRNFATDLLKTLQNVSDRKPSVPVKVGFLDSLLYIYTSGTTGLPKAATIKNSRYFMASVGNFYMHGLRHSDILYTSLPLYHGSGVMLGGGTCLCYGLSVVVRKKFSASNFWKDCIAYNVTAAQYIGEICRYLMSQPPSPFDKSHKVRVMFGNGLRAEIWPDFVKRFNISHISELYGATEGNCNMVNIDDKVGAVGFLPLYLSWVIPMKLIKIDDATGEPIRDSKTGFAIECKANEAGEIIGRIQRNHPIRDYEGYADKSSSKGKVLENAFKKGDEWFRSGDILVRDELGYFYFKDRKGDTFRWKGENCSTAEVESVISGVCGLKDAVVFGVEISGAEGRAGMAVISDPENNLDLQQLAIGISKALPSYARPLFLRVSTNIDMTGTYKLKKLDYQKIGYDITRTSDKVYFLKGDKYVIVDEGLYNDITNGKIRV